MLQFLLLAMEKLHFNCEKYKSNVAYDGNVNGYLIILKINHMTATALKIDLKMKIVQVFVTPISFPRFGLAMLH